MQLPPPDASSRALRRLARLHDVPTNFEPDAADVYDAAAGWQIDAYAQPLPGEPAGEPAPGGSWETARDAIEHYRFADPSLIRAVYDPALPVGERTMLLIGRFGPLRFHMGARVYAVVDEVRDVDGRAVRVWGWGYHTLAGHLETGRMRFQAWKWLDDGSVEFRIEAASRPARIRNPFTRLGFRVFGRRLQVRFAHRACDRMRRIVEAHVARADKPVTGDLGSFTPTSSGR